MTRNLILITMVFLPMSMVAADILVGTNGLTVNGKILSLRNGEITLKTDLGTHPIALKEIQSFRIDSEPAKESLVSASRSETPIDYQQLLLRLDNLTNAVANLERQLIRIQDNQQTQLNQLTDRTYEVNPQRNLKVLNTRINRTPGGTIVTGQIRNEATITVANIRAEVVLYGRTGKLRLSGGEQRQTVPVEPTILQPGQSGNFTARFEGGLLTSNFEVFPRGFSPAGFSSDTQN